MRGVHMGKAGGSCSYTEYLAELIEDYKTKIDDPKWGWMQELLKDEMYKLERKLHKIRESDLCAHYQMEKISQSIFQKTNFAF